MLTLSYYIIKHKASGKYMPMMKRDRGYTHWNPGANKQPFNALDTPRLLMSRESAKRVIAQWALNPNMTTSFFEDEEDVKVVPDGRQKSDLQVIRAQLIEVEKC